MSLIKNAVTLLPGGWQDKIMAKVISSDRWESVPTFNMLFESYVLMGAAREDLLEIFSASTDLGPSLYRNSRRVARRREEAAAKLSGEDARQEYQKALMLYFIADWVSFKDAQIAGNYEDLLKVSERIDDLGHLATEKVFFPWPEGQIAARFRYPNDSNPPEDGYPVVTLMQGNDTVKETMLRIEDHMLENGFAILNVDPPGWGESRLSGNRYRELDDARKLADHCITFFDENSHTDVDRAAVFGFSGAGTWAAMTAGTDDRFRWFITVGGAIYDLDYSIRWLPAIQKRQVMKHWGCKEEEIELILEEMGLNDLLPNINSRTLLVHGEKDSLVPVEKIRAAAELIKGPVELHIVPEGNHMCSSTLMDRELPYITNWLQREC